MSTAELLPLAVYSAVVSAEVDIPDDASTCTVFVARCTPAVPDIWPAGDLALSIELFSAEHAGEGWLYFGAATYTGGEFVSFRTGTVMEASTLRPIDGLPMAVGRRLRIKAEFSTPTHTRVWVEFT